MAIVTLAQIKAQVNVTADLGTADDDLLQGKIDAAQSHVERLLGFKIEERFGGEDQEPIPPALIECVSQLAAHWYANREGETDGKTAPFGVAAIVREFQDWAF